MELSESIGTGRQPEERCAPPPRNPGRSSHGWEAGGAGNHLGSLGAAYTHGKSCQQLIKEVGGGEISRGKNVEALMPTELPHPVSCRAPTVGMATGLAPLVAHVQRGETPKRDSDVLQQ